eukprot:GGOE01029050.1.p5 GENE.GGOE01029050.1~~GGOE01029050.1.p5  ORF type:complete len:122 (+),score=2.65 GGOE01029050.1:696-1061(+)
MCCMCGSTGPFVFSFSVVPTVTTPSRIHLPLAPLCPAFLPSLCMSSADHCPDSHRFRERRTDPIGFDHTCTAAVDGSWLVAIQTRRTMTVRMGLPLLPNALSEFRLLCGCIEASLAVHLLQ